MPLNKIETLVIWWFLQDTFCFLKSRYLILKDNGCLSLKQTTRVEILSILLSIKFDTVGVRPGTKHIQISGTNEWVIASIQNRSPYFSSANHLIFKLKLSVSLCKCRSTKKQTHTYLGMSWDHTSASV